jgi:hypothetical protein
LSLVQEDGIVRDTLDVYAGVAEAGSFVDAETAIFRGRENVAPSRHHLRQPESACGTPPAITENYLKGTRLAFLVRGSSRLPVSGSSP